MIRNRVHSLLHRHNLPLPETGLCDRAWWEAQKLSNLEKLQVRQELSLLEKVEQSKAELDAELAKMSTGKVWGNQTTRLLQLPGMGVVVTMAVLGAIGDIQVSDKPVE